MIAHSMDELSVVIPFYKNSEELPKLLSALDSELSWLKRYEVIIVDDGDDDNELKALNQIINGMNNIHLVVMRKNFGQHAAVLAGLRNARYSFTATIDDDLQNHPKHLQRMSEKLVLENLDVVYGTPISKNQPWHRVILGKAFRTIMAKAFKVEQMRFQSSFRLFRTSLRQGFSTNVGPRISIDALLTWSTKRFGFVSITHLPRQSGNSTYKIWNLLNLGTDVVLGYTTLPLRASSFLGFLSSIIGLCAVMLITTSALLFGTSVPGFPFLASSILFLGGVQLISIGIIGEYIARIHSRTMSQQTYVLIDSSGNRTFEYKKYDESAEK